jgi:hypothetical protein
MFKKINDLILTSRRAKAEAATLLAELLPPGTKIEFRVGNMACVHNATVLGTCTPVEPEVWIHNDDTGAGRYIPLSAILDPREARAPQGMHVWLCAQCRTDLDERDPPPYTCQCKRVLCQVCRGFCEECNQ